MAISDETSDEDNAVVLFNSCMWVETRVNHKKADTAKDITWVISI